MKLKSSAPGEYPKFTSIGDSHSGAFIRFDQDVPGMYGPENILVLQHEGRALNIRCPAFLTRTLEQNEEHLVVGRKMTLTYVGDTPTSKGNPAKNIEVDVDSEGELVPITIAVDPPKTAEAPLTKAESEIPF